MPKTSSNRSTVSIEHRLVMDRHRPMASTADAYHRTVKTVANLRLKTIDTFATHVYTQRK